MPCYDERNSPSYVEAETAARVRQECRHNSDVAELLCLVMNGLYSQTRQHLCADHPKLAKWWAEHQERDRKKAKKK